MIEDTLIHFKTKTAFNTELEAGNIQQTSIVFIDDSKEIWTHGEFYDGSKIDLSSYVKKGEAVIANGTVKQIVALSQDEYDALTTKNSTTLYIITS